MIAGAPTANVTEEEERQKQLLLLRLQELHAKEEKIRNLKEERREKEAVLSFVSKKYHLLRDQVETVSAKKEEQIQQLTQDLSRLREENSSLIQRLELQEKRHREVYVKIQEKMEQLNLGQEEKDEEIKFWKELSLAHGHAGAEATELLQAQAEQICSLKAQLESAIKLLTEKRGSPETVSGSLKLSEQEVDQLKKQFFFALAVGLKLTFMQKGRECNVSTVSLWEDCVREKVGFVSWRSWVMEKLHKASK